MLNHNQKKDWKGCSSIGQNSSPLRFRFGFESQHPQSFFKQVIIHTLIKHELSITSNYLNLSEAIKEIAKKDGTLSNL